MSITKRAVSKVKAFKAKFVIPDFVMHSFNNGTKR
jgi:hypothetical protein